MTRWTFKMNERTADYVVISEKPKLFASILMN